MAYRGTITRAEWGARPPKSRSAMRSPVGVSVGHWEGPRLWGDLWWAGHDTCAAKVRGIQNFHMNGSYSDGAYNDFACPHGWVFEMRGLGIANGASGTTLANTTRHAVCALVGQGDPIGEMPDLFDALDAALDGYVAYAGADGSRASGHRDVVATACPGDLIDAWCDAWRYSASAPAPAPGPSPVPGPTAIDWKALRRYLAAVYSSEVAAGPTLRRGSLGPEVVAWQHALNLTTGSNLTADGDYGRASQAQTVAFQRFLRIGSDGIVGPVSRRTMVAALATIR